MRVPSLRRLRRLPLTLALTAATLGATLLPGPAHAAGPVAFPYTDFADSSCVHYLVPVALAPGRPVNSVISAWLCGAAPGKTVQITVAGTTYDHLYWDFPYRPDRYSYVHAAVANGFAVLNIDKMGQGRSSHPGTLDNVGEANIFAVHQLVQKLRAGDIGGVSFAKVVTVGHSEGCAIIVAEDVRYDDVDGLILTGDVPLVDGPQVPILVSGLYPAFLDPKFANAHLPLGYLTTRPGIRRAVFYNHATTEPQVMDMDELTKAVLPATEVLVGPGLEEQPLLHAPVLLAMGELDGFFCGLGCSGPVNSLTLQERLLYQPSTCVEDYVLPLAGHDINMHRNAGDWFAASANWMNKRIGDAGHVPTHPCAA